VRGRRREAGQRELGQGVGADELVRALAVPHHVLLAHEALEADVADVRPRRRLPLRLQSALRAGAPAAAVARQVARKVLLAREGLEARLAPEGPPARVRHHVPGQVLFPVEPDNATEEIKP